MKLTFWYYCSLGGREGGTVDLRLVISLFIRPPCYNRDLSKGDDDGSENVGKTMNLHSFKLNRVYLDPLKCQMQATCPP